jgi:hypothetical protein
MMNNLGFTRRAGQPADMRGTKDTNEEPLSPIERSVVAALVSAIVKELRDPSQPVRRPAA